MAIRWQKKSQQNPDGSVKENVWAWLNGKPYSTDSNNRHFNTIVEKLENDDADGLEELFDVSLAVAKHFEPISERVKVAHGRVYFDNDEVDGPLAKHVSRLVEQGRLGDAKAVVSFWENVASNPNEHSRENLLRWLKSEDFSITHDGLIIGYKMLNSDFTSWHAGPAIVNNVPFNGHVPNKPGSVIEMARADVEHNPARACSHGLHVGTYAYTQEFAGWNNLKTVVVVHVNPRDVVSVPTDAGGSKMRVSRYVVVEEYTGEGPYAAAVV